MSRFGIREICDVTFKPLTSVDIGNQHFDAGQPILRIDTAKTSSLESAVTTVYAQGGKGNPRLIGWDGEKTLTFTFEDALMSPMSFSMLSGAGLIKGRDAADGDLGQKIYVHATYDLVVEQIQDTLGARLTFADRNGSTLVVSKEAPIYPVVLDSAGAQNGYLTAVTENEVKLVAEGGASLEELSNTLKEDGSIETTKDIFFVLANDSTESGKPADNTIVAIGDTVRIDCYEVHTEGAYEMQIEAENFAGYYYIEASTLFRDEATGVDLPAEFVIPRGKIQSNFTFSMANSGDPSTFTFTIDCFPGFTKFNKKNKVMAALQIIEASDKTHNYNDKTVSGHDNRDSDTDVNDWYTKSIFATQAGE